MNAPIWLFVTAAILSGCAPAAYSYSPSEGATSDGGDGGGGAGQVLLFDRLPSDQIDYHLPIKLVIRNDFEGSVEFVDASSFQIQVNVTSDSIDELAKVQYNYTNYQGAVMLQVYEGSPTAPDSPIRYIIVSLGGVTLLVFLLMLVFACWWNVYCRPFVKETLLFNPDSSEAPLLDNKIGQNGGPHLRHKKRVQHSSREDVASSEDDTIDNDTRLASSKLQPRHIHYHANTIDRDTRVDSDLVAGVRGSPQRGYSNQMDGTQTLPNLHATTDASGKAVVSYIKLQGDQTNDLKNRGKRAGSQQYIALSQSELSSDGAGMGLSGGGAGGAGGAGGGVVDGGAGYYNTMPDVVRSRNKPAPPERTTTAPHDRLYRTNSGRYVRLTNTEPQTMVEQDYLHSNGTASTTTPTPAPPSGVGGVGGAPTKPQHMVHIAPNLVEDSRPKHSYPGAAADKPHLTFGQPGALKHDRPGAEIDLDSVGSSRSAASSMTSGIKTQSGSVTGDSDRRTLSDSDSASISSVPAKPVGILKDTGYNPRQYIHPNAQFGTNGRQVDEAYGTMGSSNGNHSNGTGTIRSHSSIASTGSGSSGSVVTIVAAPQDAGDMAGGRRRGTGGRKGYDSSGSECSTLEKSTPGGATGPVGAGHGSTSTFTGGPVKYLHMSMMSVMLVVCLSTTVVYCMSPQSATQVHIKVLLPPGYINNGSEVYTSTHRPAHMNITHLPHNLRILKFEVPDAHIKDPDSDKCRLKACNQQCDPNTGQCLCSQGKQLNGNHVCEDVDGCQNDPPICSEHAHCHKGRDGLVNCLCKDNYYGDGRECRECSEPCTNNTYEAMPCIGSNPKQCKACLTTCPREHFIGARCTPRQDTECVACTPRCRRNEFEYSPCTGTHNRVCRDRNELQTYGLRASYPSHLVYEDRQKVKRVFSHPLKQTAVSTLLTHHLDLNRGGRGARGTGFTISISLRESNLAPVLKARDHGSSNDNDAFMGGNRDITITNSFCPYPVPEKYQFNFTWHHYKTGLAEYYHCNQRKRSSSGGCASQTGYYLSPREPCMSYMQYGLLPDLSRKYPSVTCNKPGVLSNMFDVSSDLLEHTTSFIDKTVSCAEQRTNCDTCQEQCARDMKGKRESHRCNITHEDADNGESPRLSHCLSCCSKQQCIDECRVYYDQQCSPMRCITGNIAEFTLGAIWPPRGTEFGCDVAPKEDYVIYDVEYSVLHNGRPVNDRTLRATRRYDGTHPYRVAEQHSFLKIYYGSEVTEQVNFIQGDANRRSFTAGMYSSRGRRLVDANINADMMYVRPVKPFQLNTQMWADETCDTDKLESLLLATDSSADPPPYTPNSNLRVVHIPQRNGEYRVFNSTDDHEPFIYYEISEDQSILEPLYDKTTVREDHTLQARIYQIRDKWRLDIKGQLERCPGFFSIKVFDENYTSDPLYYYDVGVPCPSQRDAPGFRLNFTIPCDAGNADYDKKMRVEITDSYRTIHVTVFRPYRKPQPAVRASSPTPVIGSDTKMTIFTPLVAVFCVAICFLAILLSIGFVTESAKPHKSTENKVHSRHLMFVVCYVSYRALYSLTLTFTLLMLLLRYTNRDSFATLMEFHRFVDTATNVQKLEVEKLQTHVIAELDRQNQQANRTKVMCENKLMLLQNTLEEAKLSLRVETNEERMISSVIQQYTRVLIANLTDDINRFKAEFSDYAHSAVDQLTRNIVSTTTALMENKWLAATKIVYDAVKAKREARGQQTKPFMEWVGVQQEVERIALDLSLGDFPMPNLTAYFALDTPVVNHQQSELPNVDHISLPRNKWYYQYEDSKSGRPFDSSPIMSSRNKASTGNRNKPVTTMSYDSFIAILVIIDVIWFIHRMAKTYTTAKIILYGCPYYIDCKRDNRIQRKTQSQSVTARCLHFIKDLCLRVMKTEFVPKLVAATTAGVCVYVAVRFTDHMITSRSLANLGYFDSLVAPVQTSYSLAKTRIKTNAFRINDLDYPFYENLVNIRTKRYQLMLDMYRDLQRTNHVLHDSEYCAWYKLLYPHRTCNCTAAPTTKLLFSGCDLPPVIARPYPKQDFSGYKSQLMEAMKPYIDSTRRVVVDSLHICLVFILLIVMADVLGAVTWIYLKRFNMLRLKPLFEIEQSTEMSKT